MPLVAGKTERSIQASNYEIRHRKEWASAARRLAARDHDGIEAIAQTGRANLGPVIKRLSLADLLAERQRTNPLAVGGEDRIEQRRGDRRHARFANPPNNTSSSAAA